MFIICENVQGHGVDLKTNICSFIELPVRNIGSHRYISCALPVNDENIVHLPDLALVSFLLL
jgi:hypothetical protein